MAHWESVDLSPDGDNVIVAASQLTGPTWNGALKVFSSSDYSMALSSTTPVGIADAKWLAKRSVVTACDDGSVCVWHWTGENTFEMKDQYKGHDNIVQCVAVMPSSKQIVSGGHDGRLRAWQAESGTAIVLSGHAGVINTISPDSEHTFASGSQDKTIRLWDVRKTSATTGFLGQSPILSTAWTENGSMIIGYGNGVVEIRDSRNWSTILHEWQGHDSRVQGISVRGERIATCGDDGAVHIWDTEGKKIASAPATNDYVRGLAWANDTVVLSVGWNTPKLQHYSVKA